MPAPYHGIGGPIPIRRVRKDELLATQRAFVAACSTLGLPEVADHNAPDATGIGPGPFNVRKGVRVSTAIAYLHPARHRSNLTIRPRCLVDRVLLDGPRAIGIAIEDEATGKLEKVPARGLRSQAVPSEHPRFCFVQASDGRTNCARCTSRQSSISPGSAQT
jgi:choline dehydrogenase